MQFSVDTHLFRELGEFLVGRDSTALAELLKNAYDADATQVTVYGENLSDPVRGYIEIIDDGVGMTEQEFELGFLRIASRLKESGARYSKRFHRRYIGAKGIGRLAAHKLARHLSINSVPAIKKVGPARKRTQAEIDWDSIEAQESLDDIGSQSLSVRVDPVAKSVKAGTMIRLTKLRQEWTETRRACFVSEIRAYQPASVLMEPLEETIKPYISLFDKQPQVQDRTANDPGFSILLKGDFEQGDEPWNKVLAAVDWVLEMRASLDDPNITYLFTPTRRQRDKNPSAEQHRFVTPHPNSKLGPHFDARILLREGSSPLKRAEDRSGYYSGIRLFLEGFRVLPYGESRNDWLGINADYAERTERIDALRETAFPDLLEESFDLKTEKEGLSGLRARSYLGGVFLTQMGASSLRMVVNREGFEPAPQFDTLVGAIRTGLGLLTRIRAYHSEEDRTLRRETRASKRQLRVREKEPTLTERAQRAIEHTKTETERAVKLAQAGDAKSAGSVLISTAQSIQSLVQTSANSLRDQSGMIRVLASVGLQMGEFVHEVRAALGEAKLLVKEVEEYRRLPDLSSSLRKRAAKLVRMAESLQRTIEWLARSLDEVSTIDKRRRRSRRNLRASFDEAISFVQAAAEKLLVTIDNQIPEDLVTCPMFASELFSILLNLLTNAVKYAGTEGAVLATATQSNQKGVRLRIENTGDRVDPASAERLFRAFESSSTTANAALGRGMGLGLPITRELVEEYGGEIRFVVPSEGYAAAVEVEFPK
jgi:signal transduction histidine kinase